MIKRLGFAHNNAIESYPFFTSAVLLALHAKVETGMLNGLMALYTVARLGYAVVYVTLESDTISQIRGVIWWVGNISCLSMMYLAGKKL